MVKLEKKELIKEIKDLEWLKYTLIQKINRLVFAIERAIVNDQNEIPRNKVR